LLAKADRPTAAAEAYRRAIDLTTDAGVVEYLSRRLAAIVADRRPEGQ
jgi:RNA polymerase sigma-70 factor (ECF subfamily)